MSSSFPTASRGPKPMSRSPADWPAALLPMVRDSGAIWVGSSGQPAMRARGFLRQDRGARHRRARHRRHAGANIIAAITKASPIRRCGRRCIRAPISSTSPPTITPPIARSTRSWRARCCASTGPEAVFWIQDYHFLTLGRGAAPARYRAAARFLPAHAVGGSPHHGRGAASRRARRGDARLRSDRLSDRRGPAEFRGLSAVRARAQRRRRHGRVGLGTDPARDLPDRHRRRGICRARHQGGRPQPRSHACATACTAPSWCSASIGWIIPRVSPTACAPSTACSRSNRTLKRAVSLLQVAVPSRGNIKAYRELKAELAALVGEVNGRHGEVDWMPIRYLNKGFSQADAGGLLPRWRVSAWSRRCMTA